MKNSDIQNLWKQHETLLESNRNFNLKLIKEIKLDKAKSSLNRLLFLPISNLLLCMSLGFYSLYFALENIQYWYFAFSGGVVAFFSFWLVISSINQLKLIITVNFNEAVIEIQKKLVKLKMAIVQNLRIVAWLLPFGPFVGIFFFKVVFNFNLMDLLNFNMIISFGIVTIVLEVISLLILRALRPNHINKKWINWLLQGNGSQINDAMHYLKSIEEFQRESLQ